MKKPSKNPRTMEETPVTTAMVIALVKLNTIPVSSDFVVETSGAICNGELK